MNKIFAILTALMLTLTATAQTLNVKVGNVTYQFPASETGEMTYGDGTTLTIMGKTFALSDIDAMTVDDTAVTANSVDISYNGTAATVSVAGNVAQWVTPTVSGGHVSIAQSNTADIDGNEITYTLSGTTADGEFALAFINLSGGVGVPYLPDQPSNDSAEIGKGVHEQFDKILVPAGM